MRRVLLSFALLLTIGAGCADAAYTWRTSSNGVAGTATFSITEPTSAASGDFEFCAMDTPTNATTITTPSGWTLGGTAAAGTNTKFFVYYVTGGRGAGAPTLSFVASASGVEWQCGGFSGSNATLDATFAQTTNTAGTAPDPPSATAVQTTDEAIAIGGNFSGSSGSWTAPTGYTIRSVNGTGLDLVFASKDLSASGAENPSTFGGATGSNDNWGATILVQASGGGGATPCAHGMLGVFSCDEARR